MDVDHIRQDFPNLTHCGWRITSEADEVYNCIGWALGFASDWWWPEPDKSWPPTIPREDTIEAFVAAFQSVGYEPCDDGTLEEGVQKIALFAFESQPTHAARQLPNGKWTSKLGKGHDIEHDDVTGVSGSLYGLPVQFLKRPYPDQPSGMHP